MPSEVLGEPAYADAADPPAGAPDPLLPCAHEPAAGEVAGRYAQGSDRPADPPYPVVGGAGDRAAGAARVRRDLAVAGYLELRERVRAEGPGALEPLHRAAAALVRDRVAGWRALWRDGALAQAQRTGERLDQLAAGRADLLRDSCVHHGRARPEPRAYGMCGLLQTWDLRPGA